MRRIQSSVSTSEERTAKKLTQAIQDLTLDLDMVGWYVARHMPYLHFRRFIEVAESASHEMNIKADIEYARKAHNGFQN
jgi:hypothetical protein